MMKDYLTVGFQHQQEDASMSIPTQVQQFYLHVPIQYRLIYLLMFLYTHQSEKVIVFASNCEVVNLIHKVAKTIDWNNVVNKRGQQGYIGTQKEP